MRISDWSSDVCSSDLNIMNTRFLSWRITGFGPSSHPRVGQRARSRSWQLLRSFGGAVVAVAIAAAVSVAAYAMVVKPVVIDLTNSGRTISPERTVENTFDKPLTVEMSIERLYLSQYGARAAHSTEKARGGRERGNPVRARS